MPHLGLPEATPLARGYQTQETSIAHPRLRNEPVQGEIDPEAPSAASRVVVRREGSSNQGMSDNQPEGSHTHRASTPVGMNTQVQIDACHPAPDNSSTADGPGEGSLESVPLEESAVPRMSRDFDDGANALWTLYRKETKNHGESRSQALKTDMDSVLIFAGLFSIALTAFIVNSTQNLRSSPDQQTAYYMQQNVAILARISQQISIIMPDVTIPSTSPPSFPTFSPLASDIRVNVFWFMALIFSLSAALLALLVQQWVRDYMHVFQRYRDPLKSARLRQYLYDGSEGWYMPILAEAVPGLLHVSLFLFFVGLVDFALNINTTVGVGTTIPIGTSSLFYIFTTFAPVICPQSTFKNPFSGLIWYVAQKLHGRKYRDRGSTGPLKPVSSNLTEGQMQLAMEETEKCKGRDGRAISWLVNNLTEESEMESIVTAIPGSFNTKWSIAVWKEFSELIEEENKGKNVNRLATGPHRDADMNPNALISPSIPTALHVSASRNPFGPILRLFRFRRANNPTTVTNVSHLVSPPFNHSHSGLTPLRYEGIRELSRRVGQLVKTCTYRGHFASDELWRKRTRACVKAITELVFRGNADLCWFGNINGALRGIGAVPELSLEGWDQSFASHWTCLSIMAIRQALCKSSVQNSARSALIDIANFRRQESGIDDQTPDSMIDNRAVEVAETIDQDFKQVWECLRMLCSPLFDGLELTTSQAVNTLNNHESQISELKRINDGTHAMKSLDMYIAEAWRKANDATERLTCQLPGVQFDTPLRELESLTFHETLHFLTSPVELLSIFPRRQLQGLCSIGSRLCDIMQGKNVEEHQETLNNLKMLVKVGDWSNREHMMETQLARLQDLRDGGGFGLAVELFFITLEKVLPKSPLDEFQYGLYLDTFKRITSDWERCGNSLGTQKVILNVVRNLTMRLPELDIALDSDFACPSEFTDALLELLRKIFKGKTGPHILTVVEALSTVRGVRWGVRRQFAEKVSEILTNGKLAV